MNDLPARLRQLSKEMTEGDPKMAAMLILAAKAIEAPRAEERQTGWQPIETVPRDGTVVLLHCSMDNLCGYASSVRSKKKIAVGYFDGHWVDGRPGGHGSGGGDSNYTHWMPLPAAPEGEG